MSKETRTFFSTGPTELITKSLLGKLLVYNSPEGKMSGYITEVEAYLGRNDSTAHAFKGRRTPSNEALYGYPGTIYIYSIHGRYMLDVAVQAKDVPHGILIRGIEPVEGIQIMEKNRLKHGFNLTNGPGKLMEALNINDKKMNLIELGDTNINIDFHDKKDPKRIIESKRIGVSKQGSWADKPYRYYVAGNPYVSNMKKRDLDLQKHGWKH